MNTHTQQPNLVEQAFASLSIDNLRERITELNPVDAAGIRVKTQLSVGLNEVSIARDKLSLLANENLSLEQTNTRQMCRTITSLCGVSLTLADVAQGLIELPGTFASSIVGQMREGVLSTLKVMHRTIDQTLTDIETTSPEFVERCAQTDRQGDFLRLIGRATSTGSELSCINQTEMATALDTSTANITGLRQALAKAGLVKKVRDELGQDERTVPSMITDEGWQAIAYHELKTTRAHLHVALLSLDKNVFKETEDSKSEED